MRLLYSRCFSAQVGQRVWPGLAGLEQLRHCPSSLALCRFSWARRRRYSMRSGVWLLARSYSDCFRFLSSAVEGSGSVRRFGATLVVFLVLGFFLEDFLAVFFWLFEEFPALAGLAMGKLNSKVWPTARRGGVNLVVVPRRITPPGASPRLVAMSLAECLGSCRAGLGLGPLAAPSAVGQVWCVWSFWSR